ncbi:MAG: HAMP domain-containing histidine kinase [Anaerolineae bacterium]|nr:HAMP domain-containing histidine kinase [Anaerolineae bacterium]
MSESPLEQARVQLAALREEARSGALIPAHLPEQIDAVLALLAAAETPAGPEAAAEAARQERARTAELISTAVHEMRIPLTSIRGYIDMLAKGMLGALPDQQQQFAETIRVNALRLERLIADINDYIKLRGGRLHLNRQPETVGNVMLGVQRRVADLAAERNVTFTCDAPEGLPLLNIDSPRLAQALVYLVENAVNYSPNGSTVTVTVRGDSGGVTFAVSDRGIGMSAAELAHLGEPFWRAEAEAVREIKGHGLGFAVARGIIEAHGGTLAVESTPGQGTTIRFTLSALT